MVFYNNKVFLTAYGGGQGGTQANILELSNYGGGGGGAKGGALNQNGGSGLNAYPGGQNGTLTNGQLGQQTTLGNYQAGSSGGGMTCTSTTNQCTSFNGGSSLTGYQGGQAQMGSGGVVFLSSIGY